MYYSLIKVKFALAQEGLSEDAYEDYREMERELARVIHEIQVGYLVQPIFPLPREKGIGGAVPIEIWVALIAGLSAGALPKIAELLGSFFTRHKDLEISVSIGDNSYSVKGKSPQETIEIIKQLHSEFQPSANSPQEATSIESKDKKEQKPVNQK